MSGDLRIVLVRHGESVWNAEGRWQGQADPPLTDRGREQARAAAPALPTIGALVASDLQRARETAELLAEPFGDLPVGVDRDLRERDAGAFSGLTRDDIHRDHPGLLPDDPGRAPGTEAEGLIPPPGWELDDSVVERAWRAVGRLADAVEGAGAATGAAVTHSGLIYALEHELGAARRRIANLEARWLHRTDHGWALGDRQLLLDPLHDPVTRNDQL